MANWMTRRQVRSQPVQSYTEKRLQKLLDAYDKAMGRLNDQYLRMMGEHIRDIGTMWPSDVHRLQQIRRMNKNLNQLMRRIAVAADRTEAQIGRAFEDIAKEDVRMQQKILGVPDAVVTLAVNLPLQRILKAQARETAEKMRNLSNTTVVSKYYRDAIDEAVTAVQSGVEDYGTAIRRVIRDAGQHGLRITDEGTRKVDYESGYSRRLDTAARMNVLDGVRHLNQSIMEEVSRQFGANGVEIDAHMLCAEDHLPYQGQQYSNEEFEEIQDSLQRPFGEWNCRHSWHGIVLGVSPPAYTPDQLQQFESYSTERVTIDGITKTRYQWSQEMRRVETAIRQQKDTATLARYAGDDKLRMRCQGTILQLNRKYEQLANKAGLNPEFERTFVAAFRDAKYTDSLTNGAKSGNILARVGNDSRIEPMPSEQFYRIVRAAAKVGIEIRTNSEAVHVLDKMQVEGITFDDKLIFLYPNSGRAAVFEELIHCSHHRKGIMGNVGPIERTRSEIVANAKLIRFAKAYKLTQPEIDRTKRNLHDYYEAWKKITGREWNDEIDGIR